MNNKQSYTAEKFLADLREIMIKYEAQKAELARRQINPLGINFGLNFFKWPDNAVLRIQHDIEMHAQYRHAVDLKRELGFTMIETIIETGFYVNERD